MLSQRRPFGEVRIDNLAYIDLNDFDVLYGVPSNGYAYTTQTPFVLRLNKEAKFYSFWIRLHRSPEFHLNKTQGTRTVQIYNQGELVAETSFLLRSDEWYLIKPSEISRPSGTISWGTLDKPSGPEFILGDTLSISANTDIDEIVFTWSSVGV